MRKELCTLKSFERFRISLLMLIASGLLGALQVRGQNCTPTDVGVTDNSAEIQKWILRKCAEINRNVPVMVTKDQRLDSAVPLDREILWMYTLVKIRAADMTKRDKQKLISALRTRVKNAYRTSPEMQPFRSLGISVSYWYFDRNGVDLFQTSVGSHD
jgi:hypothetical protein